MNKDGSSKVLSNPEDVGFSERKENSQSALIDPKQNTNFAQYSTI